MSATIQPRVNTPRARVFDLFGFSGAQSTAFLIMLGLIVVLPYVGIYPVFMMKVLCFALFACAFNLLIGYVGLMSFGHAAFFGMGSYVTAWTAKNWGLSPEIAILLGGVTGGGAGRGVRLARHPPPGHLLRDDHAGAGADGLFLLPASAIHRR